MQSAEDVEYVEDYSIGEVSDGSDAEGEDRHKKHTLSCPLLMQLKKMEKPTESDIELIERYKKGDLSASFKLLVKHYKYVLKIIIGITRGHWFSEDILQAGAVGLFEAAKRFDPTMQNTFLTYATSWIRKFVYIEVRNELLPMGGIAIGRDAKERLFKYIKLAMQEKTDGEIMAELKIGSKKLNELKIMNVTAARIKSLDYINPNSDDVDGADPYNFIDADEISPLDEAIGTELKEFIEHKINELETTNPTMAKILNMKLGVNGEVEKTKSEICDELDIKKQEFLKLEKAGNKFLRTQLIADGWYERF